MLLLGFRARKGFWGAIVGVAGCAVAGAPENAGATLGGPGGIGVAVAVAQAPSTASAAMAKGRRSLPVTVRAYLLLDPAPPLEQGEECDARRQHASHSKDPERPRWRYAVVHEPAEVHPEEPRDEREREEDRAHDGQLLHHLVLAVADGRQVEVRGAAEEVAVRVDQVRDPDQVVVDVAEVVPLIEHESR